MIISLFFFSPFRDKITFLSVYKGNNTRLTFDRDSPCLGKTMWTLYIANTIQQTQVEETTEASKKLSACRVQYSCVCVCACVCVHNGQAQLHRHHSWPFKARWCNFNISPPRLLPLTHPSSSFPFFSIIEAITSHLLILSRASSHSFPFSFSVSLYFSAVSFSSTTPLNCRKLSFFI